MSAPSSPSPTQQLIRRIAIIGAGPCGLIAARTLRNAGNFDVIDVFEQRPDVGGLWNYVREPSSMTLPSIDPWVREEPFPLSVVGAAGAWPSAIYDDLETNIPKRLQELPSHPMHYSDHLFPSHTSVLRYLRDYGDDLTPMITFSTRVTSVFKLSSDWIVSLESTLNSSRAIPDRVYDAVLVASGHYNIPYIPPIPGLSSFAAQNPGSIIHSKNYRRTAPFSERKVIVVGNSESGADIARALVRIASRPVLQSVRDPTAAPPADPTIHVVPEIVALSPEVRIAHFADGSMEPGIDRIIFATGYLHSLPFISPPRLYAPLITTGERVMNLFKHMFYIPDPTLAFIGLPMKAIPFHISQNQTAVIALVWSGGIQLPEEAAMREWEMKEIEKKGAGRKFHVFGYPHDAEYMDELADWWETGTVSVDGTSTKTPTQTQTQTETDTATATKNPKTAHIAPIRWTAEQRWLRKNGNHIRRAFREMREEMWVPRETVEVGWKFGEAEEGGADERVHVWKGKEEVETGVAVDEAGYDSDTLPSRRSNQ